MSNISEVLYKEVPSDVCDPITAGEYYFYYNMLGVDNIFIEEYEAYQENQINIRNKIIGESFFSGDVDKHPKVNSTIFGVSAIKNKVVLVVDL